MVLAVPVSAAPYAAMVIDARSGKVLHSRNADTRLHPASLTKMMTLYVAFEAVRRGEITLDTKVRISKHAASEPPSKLGLKPGQRIALRYLIRAAAVKSANDAATAIAEAVSGSEEDFARRMNRTARALGMTKTTFKNAHGLTEAGHLSTARDMTTMGRRLFYDYPQYYNLFARRSTDAQIRTVTNTNRRLLDAYRGADGIKTGYTRAAGFNLVASAERGEKRIIATMFGGTSGAARNKRVAELLDMGFSRAPQRVAVRKPAMPSYAAAASPATIADRAAVARSLRPTPRLAAASATPAEDRQMIDRIDRTVRSAKSASAAAALAGPASRPGGIEDPMAEQVAAASAAGIAQSALREPLVAIPRDTGAPRGPQPRPRPVQISYSSTDMPAPQQSGGAVAEVIVPQVSSATDRRWGISVGTFGSEYEAERVLLRTALIEIETLDSALRKVVRQRSGFEARFVGLDRRSAALACERLSARDQNCDPIGP